jgi:hypothetical protein
MKKNFRKDLLRSLHGEVFFSPGGFLIFAPRRRCPLMPYDHGAGMEEWLRIDASELISDEILYPP